MSLSAKKGIILDYRPYLHYIIGIIIDYRYNNRLLRYVFDINNLFINMKYYLVHVGRGFYYTTDLTTTLRKYGGRKSKEQKEKECNHLIIKKGSWVITFD